MQPLLTFLSGHDFPQHLYQLYQRLLRSYAKFLIDAADQVLYAAKKQGHDTYVLHMSHKAEGV